MKIKQGLEVDSKSVKSNKGRLDARGRELLDGRPMEPPVGFVRRPSLAETIRAMVRQEKLQQELASAGAETFEEADDFYVEDGFEPRSQYELLERDLLAEEAEVPPEKPPAQAEPPSEAKPAAPTGDSKG